MIWSLRSRGLDYWSELWSGSEAIDPMMFGSDDEAPSCRIQEDYKNLHFLFSEFGTEYSEPWVRKGALHLG